MGAMGQPYSDAALRAVHANLEFRLGEQRLRDAGEWSFVATLLDAAHDREALGLDASVHAASYRREVIEDVAAELRSVAHDATDSDVAVWFDEIAEFVLREFEATEAKP